MKYSNITKGVFISRPNRFVAVVLIDGKKEIVHVKNTGRCKELLVEGCPVFLEKINDRKRKTSFDLVCVEKAVGDGIKILINMDSQAPNKVVGEWIMDQRRMFHKILMVKPEWTFKDSRFDFYVEYEDENHSLCKMVIEVKGVTLEQDGIVRFPDAPTLRGLKHVNELSLMALGGEYECAVIFVVQMKNAFYFEPNWQTQKEFGNALLKAKKSGVRIMALTCHVAPDSLCIDSEIPVKLE